MATIDGQIAPSIYGLITNSWLADLIGDGWIGACEIARRRSRRPCAIAVWNPRPPARGTPTEVGWEVASCAPLPPSNRADRLARDRLRQAPDGHRARLSPFESFELREPRSNIGARSAAVFAADDTAADEQPGRERPPCREGPTAPRSSRGVAHASSARLHCHDFGGVIEPANDANNRFQIRS